MISMTGYSYKEVQNEKAIFSIEVKSYNNRFLDLSLNLSPILSPLEPFFRDKITAKCNRGRVDVNVKYRSLQEDLEIHLDEEGVKNYIGVLERIREIAHIKEPIKLENFQQINGLIETHHRIELDEVQAMIEPTLDEVLSDFVSRREKEGAATQKDILSKLDNIEAMTKIISQYAGTIEERIQTNLINRFKELMGEEVDMQRVYSEVAVYLVKATINEELERLSSHIHSFREIVQNEVAVGKKLDFLVQEMNREINTIGSKNVITEIAQNVVTAKDCLEQIREQLKNVE